ncbi:hypothetical protein Thimo_1579 [Thioflavicoccus mobilis 8321]|uniref:Uncharacterized protein n=1 Tax=Thioflavicoccus mobilis 8321 TaxID=765912 RepID=L0GYG9_9GAMM|nr:hypothetical protein [Thioflavicoccus mobilis]AGA90359.1 hypothetical protein Thimo_1579 [Thioflavicoccus mobilis 8321]
MIDEQDNAIRYKWDPTTGTGYQLRCEPINAAPSTKNRYHVEDWMNHVVTNEWDCHTLDEALKVLQGLFEIDVAKERHRLQIWKTKSIQ